MRRKGELSPACVDSGWPHQVAMRGDDLRARFDEIQSAKTELGACARGHTVRHKDEDWIVTCFATPEAAATFRQRFGGVPFNPKDRGKGKRWHVWNRPPS